MPIEMPAFFRFTTRAVRRRVFGRPRSQRRTGGHTGKKAGKCAFGRVRELFARNLDTLTAAKHFVYVSV